MEVGFVGRWVRVLLVAILLAGVGCVIVAARIAPPKPTASGTSMGVKVNGVFAVVLKSNPGTGYSWVPELEGQPFELAGEEYKSGLDLLGAPGVQVFKIKALQAGTYTLRFSYIRSWEPGSAEQAEFTVVVR